MLHLKNGKKVVVSEKSEHFGELMKQVYLITIADVKTAIVLIWILWSMSDL